jgi:hypothetical protein
MTRNICRRLEQLEERAATARGPRPFSIRILLVHPEKSCTGAIVMETDKPNTRVPPTPEEVESVRAELAERRARQK